MRIFSAPAGSAGRGIIRLGRTSHSIGMERRLLAGKGLQSARGRFPRASNPRPIASGRVSGSPAARASRAAARPLGIEPAAGFPRFPCTCAIERLHKRNRSDCEDRKFYPALLTDHSPSRVVEGQYKWENRHNRHERTAGLLLRLCLCQKVGV